MIAEPSADGRSAPQAVAVWGDGGARARGRGRRRGDELPRSRRRPGRVGCCHSDKRRGVRRDRGVRRAGDRWSRRGAAVVPGRRGQRAGQRYARVRSDQQIRHQALHDPLTRLANRRCAATASSTRSPTRRARTPRRRVLYVDVDDFKRVNDLYGHGRGDAVLISLAGGSRPRSGPPTPSRGWRRRVRRGLRGRRRARGARPRLARRRRHARARRRGRSQHRLTASVGVALGARRGHRRGQARLQRRRRRVPRQVRGTRARGDVRRAAAAHGVARLRTEADLAGAVGRRGARSWSSSPSSRSATARASARRRSCGGAGSARSAPALGVHPRRRGVRADRVGRRMGDRAGLPARPPPRWASAGDRWLSVNLSPRQIADPDLVEVVTRSLESSGLRPRRCSSRSPRRRCSR